MKIFFKLMICLMVVSAIVYSCKKDKPASSNNPQFITASPWFFSAAQVDQNNDGTGDVSLPPSILTPCYTDNFLTFTINGSGIVDEGLSKCNPGDPQTVPFTWGFTNGEQNINFSTAIFPGATGDFKIIKLDASVLILSKLAAVPGYSSQVTVIITFIH